MIADVGIPNLAEVDGSVLRGGQPSAGGWCWLKNSGITKIVKLNLEGDASDSSGVSLGMTQTYCPIDLADQIIFKPDYSTVMAAVNAIQPGTFVHCTHGQDRTGLVIGCYRVLKQGWTKDAAWAEMLQHGFHPELLGLTLFWEWAI